LRKVAIDKLAMVAWRPRPPCCLDDAKLKELKRQMKTLAEKFAAADEKEAGRASLEVMDNRRKLMAEWLAKKEESAAMEADEERLELRGKCSRNTLARTKTGGLDTDDHDGEEMEEETIEFIIETIRTEVENSRKEVEVAKD
jgi:translation initiation factor 3 subunit B